MSPEALVIALSKVSPAAVELEILSPDWNMEYFCNKWEALSPDAIRYWAVQKNVLVLWNLKLNNQIKVLM